MQHPGIYNIIEVANCHGGNYEYLISLIDEYAEFSEGFGMKFQPLKYDAIATPDYEWYEVYKKLYFTEEQWQSIFAKVKASGKDIWLDLFDAYGVALLTANLDKIKGVKFQSSILQNEALLEKLSHLDVSALKLIINIAGHELANAEKLIRGITDKLQPQELLIEIGFQAYPTALVDSGIAKIAAVKEVFKTKIVFADHIKGGDENSKWLPIIAIMKGADYIEKHVMHSQLPTEYDHFSAMKIEQYRDFIRSQKEYLDLLQQPFLNDNERAYLSKTQQIPILSKNKEKGQLIAPLTDIEFKRTNKTGLGVGQLKALQENFHILRTDKKAKDTLISSDFKRANIAVIIACRLKSSRLPQKALQNIGDITSIEYCIKNALSFSNVNNVVLATSSLESDSKLKDYTYSKDVIFHTGDPEDVIHRYLKIIEILKIDVVIRVTGDMPFISDNICQILLESHFKTGADYTVANNAAVGTNLEIINTASLVKIKQHFPNANYSEYMTWYFQNNPEHFNLNFVALPDDLSRTYRLTLDYEEDLIMFNAIEKHFQEIKKPFDIHEMYKFLDEHPEVAAINSHLTLKYKTDQTLIDELNTHTKIKTPVNEIQ